MPSSTDETPALELVGVSINFGALQALTDISMKISQGERRALLGVNGAGKTTLFNAITGDFLPSHGKIMFFGEDITTMQVHKRIRRGLRRTYQTSLPFSSLSVLDNFYLAACGVHGSRFSMKRFTTSDIAMQNAKEIIKFMQLEKQENLLAGNLSHGQQRQLEIGMALSGESRLILLDEPAAGLSQPERQQLITVLHNLPKQITLMIIEHDLDVALKVANFVTILNQGALFCEGTPEEISNDARVQSIYFGDTH